MTTKDQSTRSKLTRRIVSTMSLFASVEVVGMLCSVIRTKLVALWIGASGVGLLGLFNSAVEMICNLSQLGLRTSGVREIAAAGPDLKGRLIATVLRYGRVFAIGGSLLTILLSPLLSLITFGDFSYALPFMALSIMVGCNNIVASQSAVMQGTGHLKAIASATMWAAVVSLAAVVPLIYFMRIDSIVIILLVYGAVTALFYALFSRRSRAEAAPVKAPEAKQLSKSMLRLGLYLTISGTAGWLTSYLIMSYLNYRGGETTMGYYQSGYTIIIRYVGVLFTALAFEYFPRLSAAMSSGLRRGGPVMRHELLIIIPIATAVGSVVVFAAPWIVRLLYSESFMAIVPMVVLAVPGITLRALSFALSYTVLAAGRGKAYLMMELSSYAVCITGTVIGYHFGGLVGLGLSFTAWYLIYTLITLAVSRSTTGIRLGRKCTLVSIGCILWLTALSACGYMMLA